MASEPVVGPLVGRGAPVAGLYWSVLMQARSAQTDLNLCGIGWFIVAAMIRVTSATAYSLRRGCTPWHSRNASRDTIHAIDKMESGDQRDD